MLLKLKTLEIIWSVITSSKIWQQTSNRPGPDILGKLSHQMSSASILGNLYFRSPDWTCTRCCSALSIGVSHESKSLFPGVWWHRGWLAVPDWAFPVRLKRIVLEVSFPIDKISRLQDMMLTVLVSWECTVKRLLYQNMVIFNRNN